jgi:hypothetical protein
LNRNFESGETQEMSLSFHFFESSFERKFLEELRINASIEMKLIAKHLSLTSAGFGSGSKQKNSGRSGKLFLQKKWGKTPPDF